MQDTKGAKLVDRLKTAAEAKQALLAKFKPKPTTVDPLFAERGVEEELADLAASADHREAIAAFMAKRSPLFRGE